METMAHRNILYIHHDLPFIKLVISAVCEQIFELRPNQFVPGYSAPPFTD
jgi:hypothetical protein